MIAGARAVIEAGGVLREVLSRPPLTLRQVRGEDAATCTLCLVGSAAGPLAGDVLDLELTVGPQARAALIATGASLAQGRDGPAARLSSRVRLAEGASLVAAPPPLIVCAGGAVESRLELDLAAEATLRWRELLVLGRFGETAGPAGLEWRVNRAGRPVLRQRIDLTEVALRRWPGMLAGAAVLASALITGPLVRARTLIDSPTAICQRVEDQTALLTVLDSDAASAQRRLETLLARLESEDSTGPGSGFCGNR